MLNHTQNKLRIDLCGVIKVCWGDIPIDLSQREKLLLAYLVLHPDKLTANEIEVDLFPTSTGGARSMVSRIRSDLYSSIQNTSGLPQLKPGEPVAVPLQELLKAAYVDIKRFDSLIQEIDLSESLTDAEMERLAEAASLWRGIFLEDLLSLDLDWINAKASYYDRRLQRILPKLLDHADRTGRYEQAMKYLEDWRLVDERQEGRVSDAWRSINTTLKQKWIDQIEQRFVVRPVLPPPEPKTPSKIHSGDNLEASVPRVSNPPRTPRPFIGRTEDLKNVKQALGIVPGVVGATSKIISIHGVPGVGKSTFAAWCANDPEIRHGFPDVILWTAFGLFETNADNDFEVRERLRSWGTEFGEDFDVSMRTTAMTDRLAKLLRNRRALLICDDIWSIDQISAIRRLAEGGVRLLVTSRSTKLAETVVSNGDGVIEMKVFSEEDALLLLREVASEVVERYPTESRLLVQDLEYLPLAITVAGPLLKSEMKIGLDVVKLIDKLRNEPDAILEEDITIDMTELVNEAKSRTVAAWLKRSTQVLDPVALECFISLGFLTPKPATFGLPLLQEEWEEKDINAILRTLVNTGLIQPTSDGQYQMHALLATLARSMG